MGVPHFIIPCPAEFMGTPKLLQLSGHEAACPPKTSYPFLSGTGEGSPARKSPQVRMPSTGSSGFRPVS